MLPCKKVNNTFPRGQRRELGSWVPLRVMDFNTSSGQEMKGVEWLVVLN